MKKYVKGRIAAHIQDMTNAYTILPGRLKGRNHVGVLGIDRKILLKWFLDKHFKEADQCSKCLEPYLEIYCHAVRVTRNKIQIGNWIYWTLTFMTTDN
jgi:hypothetical protein